MDKGRRGEAPAPLQTQTERVKALLAQGCSNKEIELRTGLSKSGVKWQIRKLYRQAGCYGAADWRRLMAWILTGKCCRRKVL
jgi:DNA-binding NarL/FixJ family response regulator